MVLFLPCLKELGVANEESEMKEEVEKEKGRDSHRESSPIQLTTVIPPDYNCCSSRATQ
jgi:hypothetical protein